MDGEQEEDEEETEYVDGSFPVLVEEPIARR